MADTPKRKWYQITRIQGLAITALGGVLYCFKETRPIGQALMTIGTGWTAGGVNAVLSRKRTAEKSPSVEPVADEL